MANNRLLRDTTDSETVNILTWQAEVLMYRLFMKADDFGSFHANPKLVKSALFPLKDNIRETDVTRWMEELQKAGLIFFYEVANKKFLRVINFGQRLRNMRNAFPAPKDDPQQIAANRSKSPPEEKRREDEYELEVEEEKETVFKEILKNWEYEKKSFLKNEQWMINFSRQKNIDFAALEILMGTFITDIELREDHKEAKELRNHFTNYFNKLQKEKNGKKSFNGSAKQQAVSNFINSARDEYAFATRGETID